MYQNKVKNYFHCHLKKVFFIILFYVFWGEDYESEICLWRSASDIQFA